MAIGDDALDEGMDLVSGSSPANTLDTEDNKTRDYIAQFFRSVRDLILDVWPTSRGGTGRTNVFTATATSAEAAPVVVKADGTLYRQAGAFQSSYIPNLSGKRDIGDGQFWDTPIYTPHGRANPVTSSYVAAWINGDGRIGASASSARYKDNITDYDPADILSLRPVTFTMIDDPLSTPRLGLIAEEVNTIEPLLVRHEDGEPEGVHYEFVAVALLAEVQRLAARVQALEDRLAEEPDDAP